MDRRLELSKKLHEILGTKNVYFQPGPKAKMEFPCIVYTESLPYTNFSNNKTYNKTKLYNVKYISRTPINPVDEKLLAEFLMIKPRAFYIADNLNHWPYDLYF